MQHHGFRIAAVVLCASMPAFSLKAYYIGNSLTDCLNYNAFKTNAKAVDASYEWGRHMIPGAPLDWNWTHGEECIPGDVGGCYRSALRNNAWDVVTLQPYDRGITGSGDNCCDNDLDMTGHFMDYAKSRSPDAQFYIYAQWPNQSSDFDGLWLRKYPSSYPPRYKAYYEELTKACQGLNNGMKKVLMIPAGHVLYELNQQIKAGTVPGVGNVNGFYADGTHLNGKGAYVVACTFYACMYRQNPSRLGYAGYDVNAGLAGVIQAAAWKVVTSNQLTGVTGTPVAAGLPARSAAPIAGLAGTMRLFGIDGRERPASRRAGTGLVAESADGHLQALRVTSR